MGKIPTKYIEKMYNDVVINDKEQCSIFQRSSYYGTNGLVWQLEKRIENTFNYETLIYYDLIHYGTKILTITEIYNRGIERIEIKGGYSSTDQTAINGLLHMFGLYNNYKCLRHDEYLSLVRINDDFKGRTFVLM